MANTLTNITPKLWAGGLMAMRENAIGPRLVNRDYESLVSAKGKVINIPIPSAISARAVTPSVVMNSNVAFAPTVALVTLDHWMEAPFEVTDTDFMEGVTDMIPMQASEAIKALANDADSFLYGRHTGLYGLVGSPGATPFGTSVTVASSARTLLNRYLAPLDNRRVILDPTAEGNLLTTSNIIQFDQRGDQGGIVSGTIGTKLGFDWYMDQNVPSFTPGGGWVTGFALSTVGAAVGDTTLNILNATASGTIKVGDIFNLGAQQYVVTASATASATTAVVITFKPALTTAQATGAAITVIATAYTANLAFQRDAFAWASRPLSAVGLSSAGHVFQGPNDPVSGIALRLELSRQYKLDTYSFDYLAGCNVVREALAIKIAG